MGLLTLDTKAQIPGESQSPWAGDGLIQGVMALRAEIISIGDELTSGNRLDTNSQWLSQQLGAFGIQTAFHTTVGDCHSDNIAVFRNAAARADIVISTGGLGPTADDLTREAIADAFQRPLALRQEALDHIEKLFATRNRPMPERNRVQAMFPEGARIIPNPHGTAPGIDIVVSDGNHSSRIFALPGVPAEMKQMFQETIDPLLVRELGAGKTRWYYRELKLFGIGESDVEKMIPDLIARDRDPVVGITVSKATITLRIAACCESEEVFRERIAPTESIIREKLGALVFGSGSGDLDEAVAKMLDDHRLKLGVIEYGAGVWIAPALSKHQTTDPEFGLVAARWYPQLPPELPPHGETGLEREASLQSIAEEMLHSEQLDLCLLAATYPPLADVITSTTLPSSDFTMVLARRDRKTLTTQITLGAHPDVLYHRLAKTGLNFLRTELLKRD
ncbi:Putative competence-damage inducible protein [Pirellula sp. SH-Sr6A]|uniref:competence/damage-inducible protein A n=1 Tax=Pirellula sp. SH-Sr6A TaxID=1632865 RepID=UPI00078B8BCD|nr:CinA family nicotinamide mononucleotide deamidase-related protein [Pirellula sp. SH-Sr6A]AMV30624.1 Putative competence-damage inducible protein [Pirellula sp. SH-Sr6A]